ncbi:hypothetical protein [Campylobacter troglodytis]|uniref:hypothetical protein n=1 Tax=Campylobacter troglodytis TaxID=654363 RepID=UPI00115B0455|nr:hypothetical protein [Campylobacter troglodytis]TQR56011.1 hypothetical protein DMC01_09480 [Campylobacter troglodytis]
MGFKKIQKRLNFYFEIQQNAICEFRFLILKVKKAKFRPQIQQKGLNFKSTHQGFKLRVFKIHSVLEFKDA